MAGQRYGKWVLVDRLGGGGDTEVWRAKDDAGEVVAIKVFRRWQPSGEFARRVRHEVATVRELVDDGVLPVLDAHLPVANGLSKRAWLAMPVATPIREALGPAPRLEDVVAAIMSVADTLAWLAERDLTHRAVKPENIHRFDGRWVVSDVGLVANRAADGKSRNYVAPEMADRPSKVDGDAADVYALAKTLWVLVSEKRFPPPGQHDFEAPAMTVSAYVDHPRAAMLDMLVHEATAFEPSRRPDAATFRDDLSEWLGEEESPVKHRLKVATGHLGKIQHREDWQEWLFTQASSRLLDYVNKVPGITSAAGFSSPTQLDKRSAHYFSPGHAFYVGEEIRDPGSRLGDKAAYLEIGAEVTYRNRAVELRAAHTLLEGRKTFRPQGFPLGWDIYRTEPIWTKNVGGRLDDTRLLDTCDQIGQQLLDELPKSLEALADRILMITENIAAGDTWDRYLNKLPTQPTNEPFIEFRWHPSRKRRRED